MSSCAFDRLHQNLGSYLVPAAVPCISSLRRCRIATTHHRRRCGYGDLWHSGLGFCRRIHTGTVVHFVQLLRVVIARKVKTSSVISTQSKHFSTFLSSYEMKLTHSLLPSWFHPAHSAASDVPHTQKAHCGGQKQEETRGFRSRITQQYLEDFGSNPTS